MYRHVNRCFRRLHRLRQARQISRAISGCDPHGAGVDLSLLEHVSPIEWDNVVLYGPYVLNRKLIKRWRAAA